MLADDSSQEPQAQSETNSTQKGRNNNEKNKIIVQIKQEKNISIMLGRKEAFSGKEEIKQSMIADHGSQESQLQSGTTVDWKAENKITNGKNIIVFNSIK